MNKESIAVTLRKWVVAGLLVWIPLAVTLLLIRFLVSLLDTSLLLIPSAIRPDFPGIGILLSIFLVLGTGALTANFLGARVVLWVEEALSRVPYLGSVYNGMKKLALTVFSGSGKSFRQAVLVQWPREGIWTIGFITSEPQGEIQQRIGDVVTVFVPATPNPTSGFIFMLPRSELRILDMSVEQAMRMVISLGVVAPDTPANK